MKDFENKLNNLIHWAQGLDISKITLDIDSDFHKKFLDFLEYYTDPKLFKTEQYSIPYKTEIICNHSSVVHKITYCGVLFIFK